MNKGYPAYDPPSLYRQTRKIKYAAESALCDLKIVTARVAHMNSPAHKDFLLKLYEMETKTKQFIAECKELQKAEREARAKCP